MVQTEYGALELSRSECLALLPSAPYGRLVFTEGALPAVLAINFLLTSDGVVLRTRENGAIARAAAAGAVVAFQADDIDPQRRSGWTVTVVGTARAVTDPVERARLDELQLIPWLDGDRNLLVVVEVGPVSGLRVGGAEPVHPAAVRKQEVVGAS
jgi:hypothetical protein